MKKITPDLSKTGVGALLAAGMAAVLASTCCIGPLVLITLGFSGAWLANLTALSPYRPIFIVLSLVALWLAWRRIKPRAAVCAPGEVCAAPPVQRSYRALFWFTAGLVALTLVMPRLLPLFY